MGRPRLVKPFRAPNSTGQPGGSTFLDRVLGMIEDSITSLRNAVTNDSIVSVKLDNTRDWPVSHGLGHKVTTWDIVDKSNAADVWQSQVFNSRPSFVILLRASAPVTVALRFT